MEFLNGLEILSEEQAAEVAEHRKILRECRLRSEELDRLQEQKEAQNYDPLTYGLEDHREATPKSIRKLFHIS